MGNLRYMHESFFSFLELTYVNFITGMAKRCGEFGKIKKESRRFFTVYWIFKFTLSKLYSVFLEYADFGSHSTGLAFRTGLDGFQGFCSSLVIGFCMVFSL